jgi:hypothetical protein
VGIAAGHPVLDDAGVERLVRRFVDAAGLAHQAGFAFVDVKHCHGYLGHEFLSARSRPGRYGGSFENRTRFLREVVAGIRARVPSLAIGIRVSSFDTVPFRAGPRGEGEPEEAARPYTCAFGADPDQPLQPQMEEPAACSRSWSRSAYAWSTSPRAARTTTRTSSAPRSSRPPTATYRPRIRWWAWRGRSRRPQP